MQILKYLEDSESDRFSAISQKFSYFASGELYYRLEQLRLLGFIVCAGKHTANPALYIYKLSEPYAEELEQTLNQAAVMSEC